MRSLTFAFLLVFGLVARANASTDLSLSYHFSENRRSASDQRLCITDIDLRDGNQLSYRFYEFVWGSITPRVESLQFRRERVLTIDEQRGLVAALLEAKAFDLPGDSGDERGISAGFEVRLGGRKSSFRCTSVSPSPAARRIHECILAFAKRMTVDEPADLAAALTVTEGDEEAAREVKLTDLLGSPADYHGKRVAVIGFLNRGFEDNWLGIAKSLSFEERSTKSIAWQWPSSFAKDPDCMKKMFIWARVEGIFLRGPSGHLGIWPGEITRITRVEPVLR